MIKGYLVRVRNKLFGVDAVLSAIQQLKSDIISRQQLDLPQSPGRQNHLFDNSLIPSQDLVGIGGGDFEEVGREFLSYFIKYAELRPDHRVLEIGSGMGRMALGLTNYLSAQGEYWGVDIVKAGVQWCQERYRERYAKFHFDMIDVYNKFYNANGKYSASEFVFPYEDSSFDFIFLTSVFTHMHLPDVEHYLSEISRMLKPNAKCFATFYLLNDESKKSLSSGGSEIAFSYPIEGGLTSDKDVPETVVAFDEHLVRGLLKTAGLDLAPPILYGRWSGRENFVSYQDVIIATKRDAVSR